MSRAKCACGTVIARDNNSRECSPCQSARNAARLGDKGPLAIRLTRRAAELYASYDKAPSREEYLADLSPILDEMCELHGFMPPRFEGTTKPVFKVSVGGGEDRVCGEVREVRAPSPSEDLTSLRRLIAERGLTQGELSSLSGVSREHINALAGGRVKASKRSTVMALAAALRVPPTWLSDIGDLPRAVSA